MEDRRIKFHTKGQKPVGKTNWIKTKNSLPKIDDENPELVSKRKFAKSIERFSKW